jgi:hypothetical protein
LSPSITGKNGRNLHTTFLIYSPVAVVRHKDNLIIYFFSFRCPFWYSRMRIARNTGADKLPSNEWPATNPDGKLPNNQKIEG